ncbi:MAG: hypothetical protein HS108_07755 [Planctomycetes bacterium]|nr:hypothetical protein [Planctomycetota bacterium]MCL4729368.1 hypothetical protein [Planctomycetota bacterium]
MTETAIIHRLFTDERVEAWRARYFWPNAAVSLLGLASFLLFHGRLFNPSWEPAVAVFQALCLLVLIGETLGVYVLSRRLREGWRRAPADSAALLVGVVMGAGLFAFSHWISGVLSEDTTVTAFAYLTQAGFLAFVGARLLRLLSFVSRLARSPLRVFMGSFAMLILVGTGLLMLPGAHATDVRFIDAFFTATSATCVTGLTVVDTGTAWTRFGQLVIITLVQVGGLGMMTFAAFFGLSMGSGGVRDAAAVGEMLNLNTLGRVGRATVWILGSTLVCELVGVGLLYGHWVDGAGLTLPAEDQLYYSVFHSISAFCNAGFSLHPDSIVRYVGNWPVNLTLSWLVVMGGLGFVVIMELCTFRYWSLPLLRRVPFIRRRVKHERVPHFSLQTKIVLLATGVLLVGGALGFLVLEWNHSMALLTTDEKLAAAFFQSMASRTAGFNSVDTGAGHSSTQFWTILLMLIGGSPGSVAGGIKTTTFVVMILAVVATFRSRPVEIFQRRIPDGLILKALVMLALALTFICFATLALCLTEHAGTGVPRHDFLDVLFEAASAFCTVGLSTGLTPELTDPGRVIIIACMYFGRIGPLTLVLALGARKTQRFQYPEEPVMIG